MNRKKRVLAGILSLLLAFGPTAMAFGNTIDGSRDLALEAPVYISEEMNANYDDPEYMKRMILSEQEEASAPAQFSLRSVSGPTTQSPYTGSVYTHPSQADSSSVALGIDVSEWQYGIDWAKVKQAGVEYVFIRCGYTSLGSTFRMGEDKYFKQNMEGAHAQGIKIGIYYFANSKTVEEASQEAQKTVELLAPYKSWITLPVVFDFEAFNTSYRAYGLPTAQISQNAKTYFDIIGAAGYAGMYYGSTSIIPKYFNADILNNYDCWVAQYNTKVTYTGKMAFWQYSSKGVVSGIADTKGNAIYVDCDFWYENETAYDMGSLAGSSAAASLAPERVEGLYMSGCTNDSISLEWEESEDADGYQVYRSNSYGGTYSVIDTVDECTYSDTTVANSEGLQYYYKIVPYLNANSATYYGEESKILSANTLQTYLYKLKTKANLNLRKQAGTEYAVLVSVPAGVVLKYLKYTVSTSGGKWYKVTYKANDTSYKGYLSGNYVTLYSYSQTKKNANMRKNADASSKVKVKVPLGSKLTVFHTTTDASGRTWAYVKYKAENKNYKGYVQTKFMEQI